MQAVSGSQSGISRFLVVICLGCLGTLVVVSDNFCQEALSVAPKNFIQLQFKRKLHSSPPSDTSASQPDLQFPEQSTPNATFTRQQTKSEQKEEAKTPFLLIRILGNDLPPRHSHTQTYENLQFILKHEPAFEDVTKKFIINKIVNKTKEDQLISLLKQHQQSYVVIPFKWRDYRQRVSRFDKIQYVVGPNSARNQALKAAKMVGFEWILPWDGNCYLNDVAWTQIKGDMAKIKGIKYFAVPMIRMEEPNHVLLSKSWKIPTRRAEPQLFFHRTTNLTFDERYGYSYNSKLELVDRLRSRKASRSVGFVFRLYSGVLKGEKNDMLRNDLRLEAMERIFQQMEKFAMQQEQAELNMTSAVVSEAVTALRHGVR